jgi:class 3 adenylate cyclase/tetratricopeptide (TPR) repeat protein
MDVAAWLRDLGLEAYAEAFAVNGVDAELLGDLNNEDLKDLGIAKLADRKRLLKAIADLASESAGGAPRQSKPATASGEHRQVTVLFADIVGFTRLTTELGAENIHSLLNRYFETVDAIVANYGGTVDKHMGDNVMALFGAPIAHDDDPLRAVRAAFEIHRQVSQLHDSSGRKLEVHVGIASGQVVASGTGSDKHQEYTVTGESVNLAARLLSRAQPGETLISDALHRAVAQVVDCESLGNVDVKGINQPVHIWRVKSQQVADGTMARIPFVGREAELAQLVGVVDDCRQSGRGRAIVIRGEAGLGKTRLVEEFTRMAEANGFEVHRGLVLDFGVGEGRDAIRAVVQSLLDIASGSSEDTRQAAAKSAIANGTLAPERRIFLNDLLDLPQPQEELAIYDAMTNATRNEGKRAVVADLLRAISAKQPIAVVIEDIHWAGPLILAHLAKIAATLADSRGLLVMTSRVDGYPLSPVWRSSTGGCSFMTLDLAPLRKEDSIRLAGSFIETVNQTALDCIQRAEGNPLFLEQLLRNVEEQGEGDIPASIQSLVLARIDRLAAVDKQALQAASVLGQRFELEALRHLISSPDYDCQGLIERSLIRPEGDGYLFAHALVQEGVFGSLLKNRRIELHRRAAAFFDRIDPILRAEHLDRAGDEASAVAYLEAATAQAAALRFDTALKLANRGLELVDDPAVEYGLACLRGDALRNTGATEESISAFEAGLAVAAGPEQRCRALIGIAEGLRIADRQQRTLEVLKDAEAAAIAAGLFPEQGRIHYLRGNTYFPLGLIDECRDEHEKALGFARQVGSVEGEALALSGLGDAYYLRGQMRTAGEQFRACVKLCQDHSLRRVEVANRHMIGWTRLHLMEFSEAEQDALASVQMATEVSHPRAQLLGLMLAGAARSETSRFQEAENALLHALELAQSMRANNFAAQTLRYLAENCLAQGDKAKADAHSARALEIVRTVGMTFIGSAILATAAASSENETIGLEMLEEAETILDSGCVAHNHIFFARTAIGHALRTCAWDLVERYATRLERYTRKEPLPWSDFIIAEGRVLAAWGRGQRSDELKGELRRLLSVAADRGLLADVAALNKALASA